MARLSFARFVVALATSAMVVVGSALLVPSAGANGAPKEFPLYYHPDWSNWGPTGAQGAASITSSEGLVMVTVQDMAVPDDGSHYQVWVTSRSGGPMYSAGTFEVDSQGKGSFRGTVSESIDSPQFDLLVISVELPDSLGQSPGPRRSIGGVYPAEKVKTVIPQELPNTGGQDRPSQGRTVILVMGMGAVAVVILSILGLTFVLKWRQR